MDIELFVSRGFFRCTIPIWALTEGAASWEFNVWLPLIGAFITGCYENGDCFGGDHEVYFVNVLITPHCFFKFCNLLWQSSFISTEEHPLSKRSEM